MKTIRFLVLLILSTNLYSQDKKEFNITDNSLIPIPYASIFVKGSTYGTYSNFIGKVSLKVSSQDTITISCIGFENKEIKVSEVSDTLILTKSIVKLNEFEVKSEYNNQIIGFDRRKTFRGGSIYGLVGTIHGIVVSGLKTSQIKDISLFIDESNDSSSTLFMVHIYKVNDSTNLPTQSLLSKKMFFDDSKKGWSIINLDSLNVFIDNKIFIGVEIVPNLELISDSIFNVKELNNSKFRVNLYNKKNTLIYVNGRRGLVYRVEESYSNFPMIKATIQN